jgi:hypothetical protein
VRPGDQSIQRMIPNYMIAKTDEHGTGSRTRSCATCSMNASARLDPDRAAAALVCCGGLGRDVDGTCYLVVSVAVVAGFTT